ncbi:MAG: hypothetical protein Q8936_21580 [Bacillota bacterium]|nr:hypothetical protein [Bacillota bacterium]
MENERIPIKYIENKNPDGDDIAGIIISLIDKNVLIGVTEKRGGDAEVSLDVEKAKELVAAINSAIELIDK